MPTAFIAVQCFQCSIMQVKQQKKSSNKWSCVVCNQKQSVRKVFAQGFMAKDVRKFVQNFNMSRQLADQKQLLSEEEFQTSDSPTDERKTKRNDWTEYVDDQEEYCGKFDKFEIGDDGLEPMVVTELPKVLFKKPKVKEYSSNGNGAQKLFKPSFPNRSNTKRLQNDYSGETNVTEFEQTSCERVSKRSDHTMRTLGVPSREDPMAINPPDRASIWNCFRALIQDDNINLANMDEQSVQQPAKGLKGSMSKWSGYITKEEESNAVRDHTIAAKKPVSKWSSFITEEDEDNLESRGRIDDQCDRFGPQSNFPLEWSMNDERVEDDVHPDFL